jgi:hypothetical protein
MPVNVCIFSAVLCVTVTGYTNNSSICLRRCLQPNPKHDIKSYLSALLAWNEAQSLVLGVSSQAG